MDDVLLNKFSGLMEAIRYFSDPMICLDAVAMAKWGKGGPECPRCQSKRNSFIRSRMLWTCLGCRKQYSVKVGTIFEDSAVALDKWLVAMWMLANCKNGVSSYEVSRAVKVTQRTAWFMLHRIRYAQHQGGINKMSGTVEVDETFIGGKARNMHSKDKARKLSEGKAIVAAVLERGGKIRATVVDKRKKKDLHALVKENVEVGSTVYSDDLRSYDGLDADYVRGVVNHADEYVNGKIHTNGCENFWSLLKRTIKGTYVSVEPFHLFRYVDEQSFRFNERKRTDSERFTMVLSSIAGKRLTWNILTAQEVG